MCSDESESKSCSVLSNHLQTHGLYSPCNSPSQNTGVGPFPSPGDLPNPGIKPRSSTLQADSLPAEPQGKPKNTYVLLMLDKLWNWTFSATNITVSFDFLKPLKYEINILCSEGHTEIGNSVDLTYEQ